MEKKVIVTPDHEITSQLSKALPTTKYSPKKMKKDRISSKGNCSKLMALQEALQDPVTVYEGI